MDTKILHKATFTSAITKLHHAEMEEMLSKASAESLKPLFPDNINLQDNPDVIGINFAIANCSYANKNAECINNQDGLRIGKNFLYKNINAEHSKRIIGACINVGYSTFKDNVLLTAEQVKELKEPYNIALAGVLYKHVLSDEFIELLEQTVAISGPEVWASWELFYGDYDIAVGPTRNLFDAQVFAGEEDKKDLEKYLPKNKGSGKKDGNYVFRVLKGDLLLPTGVGLVNSPAGFFTSVSAVDPDEQNISTSNIPATESNVISISTEDQSISISTNTTILDPKLEISPNPQILSVNTTEANKDLKTMAIKFTKLEDFTDENVKLAVANDITNFISDELKKANEQWTAKVEAEKGLKADLEAKNSTLAAEVASTKTELQALKEKLASLEQVEAQRLATEQYNQRLAAIDADYDVTADERKVVAKNIQGMTVEAFNTYFEDLKVLFASKKKSAASVQPEISVASADVETVLENGTKNGSKDTPPPNAQDLSQKTYKDRFAKAFTVGEGVEIVHGKKKVSLK